MEHKIRRAIAIAIEQKEARSVTKTSIKTAEKLLPDFLVLKEQIEQIDQSLKSIDDKVIKSNLFYEINSLKNRFSGIVDESGMKEQIEDAIGGLQSYIG